jgi:hypothetical protein
MLVGGGDEQQGGDREWRVLYAGWGEGEEG